MGIKRIAYKGQQVLVADYRGLAKAEQSLQCLEELGQTVRASSTKELILSNYEGVSIGPEFMTRVKALGKEFQPKIKRQAVLGVTGLKNVLLQGYISFTGEKDIKAFNSEAEALDWLVS